MQSGHAMLCPGLVAAKLSDCALAAAALRSDPALEGGGGGAAVDDTPAADDYVDFEQALANHPLMRFKQHAIATNEVFLMAAQVGRDDAFRRCGACRGGGWMCGGVDTDDLR